MLEDCDIQLSWYTEVSDHRLESFYIDILYSSYSYQPACLYQDDISRDAIYGIGSSERGSRDAKSRACEKFEYSGDSDGRSS